MRLTSFNVQVKERLVTLGGTLSDDGAVVLPTPAGQLHVTTSFGSILARFAEPKRANILFRDERWADSPHLFTGEWAFYEESEEATLARFEQRLTWLREQTGPKPWHDSE